jgi:hypothetical protein
VDFCINPFVDFFLIWLVGFLGWVCELWNTMGPSQWCC